MSILIVFLLLGIIAIRISWMMTEVRSFRHRLNLTLLKTNLIEVAIFAAQVLVVYYFPLPATPFDTLITFVGIAMYVAGMILAFWARGTMKHSWGIPGEHAAKQDALVTKGPFAFSRNPIYLAFTLIYLGFCIAIKSWMIILRIPLLLYFYKSAVKEEKLLEEKFGKEYVKYKRRVPRFL